MPASSAILNSASVRQTASWANSAEQVATRRLDWTIFAPWKNATRDEFENHLWQDKNSVTRVSQLRTALVNVVADDLLEEIEAGLHRSGMSIRINPYVMSLIDWSEARTDPI